MRNHPSLFPTLLVALLAATGLPRLTLGDERSDKQKSPEPTVKLREWGKGIAVESLKKEGMIVYLWFYEWNMFEARAKGQHTRGSHEWKRTIGKDGRTATIDTPDMKLSAKAVADGAELTLKITNKTKHAWPEIAGIIPCFNPGAPKGQSRIWPRATLNPQFNNRNTWYIGKSGLQKQDKREIHFNTKLRKQVDKEARDGRFVFSEKWPTSKDDAYAGLMLRESTDGRWVTGIAWERFLSAQGHNPWACMHLSINVGPLKPGESRTIRGRIYLFEGSREDLYKRYRRDFTTVSRGGKTVRVAGVVAKWVRGQKETNYRRVEPLIREAARNGAKIVCTTECFLDGYAIADKSIPLKTYRALGEQIPGGTYFEKLGRLAKELRIHLIAGMLEADGDDRFNTAVVISPDGRLVGKYRKQQLGHESVRNKPGKTSRVFETSHGKVGVMICADRRYPDLVKRFCTNGADVLICPSGGMFGSKRNDPIVQKRSRENRRYIVFVHPAEFLVTAPDGSIASRTILGDRLLVKPDEVNTNADKNRVFYFDLPISPQQTGRQ